MKGYKGLTQELLSPVTYEGPMFDDGPPAIVLGKAEREDGVLFWKTLPGAIRFCGLWPCGRPARFFSIKADGAHLDGSIFRSKSLVILQELREAEVENAIFAISKAFGGVQRKIAESQVKWRRALSAPHHDSDVVVERLEEALEARRLPWGIREFETAQEMREAFNSYAALQSWQSPDFVSSPDTGYLLSAVFQRALDLWSIHDGDNHVTQALFFELSSLLGETDGPPEILTAGIRDAFEYGLEAVLPVGEDDLGYSMLPGPHLV